MRDLLKEPLWQAKDLGKPIPDSPHAVSVALPLWEHVIGYEEKDPAVIDAMDCGYPRFFCHPTVTKLFTEAEKRFAQTGQRCLVFPSLNTAKRCVEYVHRKKGMEGRVDSYEANGLYAATFDAAVIESAHDFWRYSGEIVSSRLAQATLANELIPAEAAVKKTVRERIGHWANLEPEDIYLFSSGIAATDTVQRMLQALSGPCKTVQVEFPYVDVLRVQKEFGEGAHFFPVFDPEHFEQLDTLLAQERIAGLYSEMPSNPLMRSVDLAKLAELAARHDVPLIVDDTIGTSLNLDTARFADLVTTSLTKYFSGVGDVLAGSLGVNKQSRFYSRFNDYLREHHEDLLWAGDAVVLEQNSRDFSQRVRRINETAPKVVRYLSDHPRIEKVYYPTVDTPDAYRVALKSGGGGGGLLSILLKDAAQTTEPFYNALSVSKGPSLGTNYTLACPCMLLAHYEELDWAEQCGVSRYLIRVSIGLEDTDDLIGRFEQALSSV